MACDERVSLTHIANSIVMHQAIKQQNIVIDSRFERFSGPRRSKFHERLNRYFSYPSQYGSVSELMHIVDEGYAHIRLWNRNARILTLTDLIPLVIKTQFAKNRFSNLSTFPLRSVLRCVQGYDDVIFFSNNAYQIARKYGYISAKRNHIIPLGIDTFCEYDSERKMLLRTQFQISQDAFVVMLNGASNYKNHDYAVEVLSEFQRKYAQPLTVLRLGPKVTKNTIYSKLAEISDYRVVNNLSRADVLKFYQATDVVFFPSLMEGFGMPPLEALACGTPAIVSDIPIFEETLSGYEAKCNLNDLNTAVNLLREIQVNEEFKTTLIETASEILKRYKWDGITKQYQEIYSLHL